MPGKKVLIVTYYWPPSGGSGVQRWLRIVKYLKEYGWEPVVYTPENPEYPETDTSFLKDIPEGLEIIRQPIWEPYQAYKRIVGLEKEDRIAAGFLTEKKKNRLAEAVSVWLRGNLFIPDARCFWIRPSVKYLKHYLRDNELSAIISNGPPHSMHLIALALHGQSGIPWLADFCDPWTSIDFYDMLRLTWLADKRHHTLEKRVLSAANVVTVVTPNMADEFKRIVDRKYPVITNGFDDADLPLLEGVGLDQKFSIAHIGSLVPGRNPKILWDTLGKMVKSDSQFASHVEIKLVGKTDLSVTESIIEAGLEPFLRKINYLPHDEALRETRKSQVLLLLINQAQNARGIVTGKLFEYLAVRRPVLCLGPEDGDASMILMKTGAGIAVDYNDGVKLENLIGEYYRKFLNGELIIPDSNISQYTWRHHAGLVAQELDKLVKP